MWKLTTALLATAVLTGCVRTTQSISVVDPSARGAPEKVSSPVVMALTDNLSEQNAMESALVKALADRGIQARRGADLFPPTRNWTRETRDAVLNDVGVAYVIVGRPTDKHMHTDYTPPTFIPGTTQTTYRTVGGTTYATTTTTPGRMAGGELVSKPRGTYDFSLVRRDTDRVVWRAQIGNRGSVFVDFDDLAASAARQAVAKMAADGFL